MKIETRYEHIDWLNVAAEVQTKLGYLRASWQSSERDCPPELHKKMVTELYFPILELLGRFCGCIQEQDGELPVLKSPDGETLQ